MSGSTNAAARISAASSDDLTSEELNQLLQDEDVSVRAAACKHPRLTWRQAGRLVIGDLGDAHSQYLYNERGFSLEAPNDPDAQLPFGPVPETHAVPGEA